MFKRLEEFWALGGDEALSILNSSKNGLIESEARQRLSKYGLNLIKPRKKASTFTLFISQFKSPIIIILLSAAILSYFLGEKTDTIIILMIVFISGLLGFWQEKGATRAVEKLLAILEIKADVLRDGKQVEIPISNVVLGDIVILNAGDSIPGDCLILESKDFFVDEAILTGETYPESKEVGILKSETPLGERTNALFMGTHVVSGWAKALVVFTGKNTEFGKISERLKLRPPDTEFERGVRRFGYLLMEVTMTLVIAIFAINIFLSKPVLDSFLFAVALAVGLTPQLLPAIISVNLAKGAKRMAESKVIVKRLASIENFGSINVLCSDKTGTLTEGVVSLSFAIDFEGNASDKVLLFAYLNASYQTSFDNPIDEAIKSYGKSDISKYQKLDEIPYDFIRKMQSILISGNGKNLMITKGAFNNVIGICSQAEGVGGKVVDINLLKDHINYTFRVFSDKGYRILGVSYKDVGSNILIDKGDEKDMIFLGFLVFFDPPKKDASETIRKLNELGITLKIITGDNRYVSANVSEQVGLKKPEILTGSDMRHISEEALIKKVNKVDIFAEVDPNQKERILLALREAGNVVGFLGDGINDAPALHTADVGISVDSAVDVAKEAADFVLLEKDLKVLVEGVKEGRVTFSNTLKYVFIATSANFGNMFSMAGVSLFLPFLPLLPKQILLTNLLTDIPEMTIATDSVDRELIGHPRRWNIKFIRNFMITFGLLSSIFDFATFSFLLFFLNASQIQFRTGWFIESVISASGIVLVIRTRRFFIKSIPSRYLLLTTFIVFGITLTLPYIMFNKIFGFTPLPLSFLLILLVIMILYIASAEAVKRLFYKLARY